MDISSRESTGSADTAPPLSLTEGRYGERGGGADVTCHTPVTDAPIVDLLYSWNLTSYKTLWIKIYLRSISGPKSTTCKLHNFYHLKVNVMPPLLINCQG